MATPPKSMNGWISKEFTRLHKPIWPNLVKKETAATYVFRQSWRGCFPQSFDYVARSAKEYTNLFVCEFRPDPIVHEIVAFLRYATDKEIREYKNLGLLPKDAYREAKRILEQEREGPL